ncbi:hypothetical protein JOM56_006821 [Amanita muscaria]
MIKIDYTLSVSSPKDTEIGDLSPSKSHSFEVKGDKESYKDYYGGLRDALGKARNTVGDELTRWKELVGKDEEKLNGVKQNEREEEEEPEEEEVCVR